MKKFRIRWQLVVYDLIILGLADVLLLVISKSTAGIPVSGIIIQVLLTAGCVFVSRLLFNVYGQIWRYGGIQCYMHLFASDGFAFILNVVILGFIDIKRIHHVHLLAIICMNLLGALCVRMLYRYAFKCGGDNTVKGRFLTFLLKIFAGKKVVGEKNSNVKLMNVAIIGAGRVGVSLAEELKSNSMAVYRPRCFVDVSKEKVGRDIQGISVYPEDEKTIERLKRLDVEEVIFAIHNLPAEKKKDLYERYKNAGFKIEVYDQPTMQTFGTKIRLREFDIEELLFREPIKVNNELTSAYYRGKVILITGGGGSIGSEICRQIAKMQPRRIIILDVYENGAYDVQQELKILYKGKLDIHVEIVSVCNRAGLERVFAEYRPQIVINAAAHKHVPLMEKNCIEAVENNVFGTLNSVEVSEKYGVERFIMVSTDKAVNPTNVMGATKRMCEMIILAHSRSDTSTTFSATRFGNVLGSAGSVIPLFKKQIANGGPVTVTDKRIIRYFMTIPEASQLVLQSGAMANNGELFVLDMGQPVKIYDLAENMIKLAGFRPGIDIEIVETGLRPGEKLYEELLVKTEELDKTENSLIFIERDEGISMKELEEKLYLLRKAVETNDDGIVRKALHYAVPSFHAPEEVNKKALESEEMKNSKELAPVL